MNLQINLTRWTQSCPRTVAACYAATENITSHIVYDLNQNVPNDVIRSLICWSFRWWNGACRRSSSVTCVSPPVINKEGFQ